MNHKTKTTLSIPAWHKFPTPWTIPSVWSSKSQWW